MKRRPKTLKSLMRLWATGRATVTQMHRAMELRRAEDAKRGVGIMGQKLS